MPQLQLSQGQVIQVKVLSIKENVKEVKKRDGLRYRHDILVEDRSGNTLNGEYLSFKPAIGDDFVPNVLQYIRCLYPERDGATIEPADPPKENSAAAVSQQLDEKAGSRLTDVGPSTLNLSGNSIAFSFAWAKDLVVADIMMRPYRPVTEDDVKRVIEFGVKINDGICDFMQYN